jgi:hypothetical protein
MYCRPWIDLKHKKNGYFVIREDNNEGGKNEIIAKYGLDEYQAARERAIHETEEHKSRLTETRRDGEGDVIYTSSHVNQMLQIGKDIAADFCQLLLDENRLPVKKWAPVFDEAWKGIPECYRPHLHLLGLEEGTQDWHHIEYGGAAHAITILSPIMRNRRPQDYREQ